MYKVTLASNFRQLFSTKKKGIKWEFTQKPIKTTRKGNGAVDSTNKEQMKEGSVQIPKETTKNANVFFGLIRNGKVEDFIIQIIAGFVVAFVTCGGVYITVTIIKTPDKTGKTENEGPKQSKDPTPPPQHEQVAEGLAWSHYIGYTRIVLRELATKIEKSQLYKGNEKCFPLKEFNIFPLSAKSMRRLTEFTLPTKYDFKEMDKATIDPIESAHGSFKQRKHEVTVYTILDPKTAQDGRNLPKYFFVALIPHSLTVLKKLEKEGIIKNRKEEAIRYMDTLRNIVYRLEDQKSRNVFRMIPVQEDLPSEEIAERFLEYIKDDSGDSKMMDTPRSVFVDYTTHIHEDERVAKELKTFLLEQKKYTVLDNDPGINETKCMVLIESKQSLRERKRKQEKREDLYQRWLNKATLIVVLTDDLTEEELTTELQIRPHILLRLKDENFWESLLQEITHGHRDSDIPETAKTGLAYAYVYNYLETNLKGADERMKKMHKQSKKSKLYKKLLIIVPKLFVQTKVLELSEEWGKIAGFEALKPDTKEEIVSGIESRSYQLEPYKVKEITNHLKFWKLNGGQKEYLVVAEYPNPVLCLQSIREIALAHWSKEKLEQEVNGFIELTKQLIEKSKVRGKAHVLYIDEKDNVKDAIVKFLKEQEESNPGDFEVYQEPPTKSTKG